MHRYRITRLGDSSAKYGLCEVCGGDVSDVFLQVEERHYEFTSKNQTHSGWTQHECHSYFGHEHCLINKRRGTPS